MKFTFSEVINKLNQFWCDHGCVLLSPSVTEVGAGTLAPATLLGCLANDNYRICYTQPSIRPADARYGENINRLYMHHQYQVIIKDVSEVVDVQKLYLKSLEFIGVDFSKNDIRFIEDDWKNASVGAFGLGWEIWFNGTEVTQFTYMQQIGGVHLKIIPIEVTYGLERLLMCLQEKENVFEIDYSKDKKYGDIFKANEYDFSCFVLDEADIDLFKDQLTIYIAQAKRFLTLKNARVAYDFAIKASHIMNILDARRAINVNERTEFLLQLKNLVNGSALLVINKE